MTRHFSLSNYFCKHCKLNNKCHTLTIISLFTVVACVFPIVFPKYFIPIIAPDDSPIDIALQSKENLISLVASTSITGPLFFDLFIRVATLYDEGGLSKSLLPNAILLISLVGPNMYLLIHIIPNLDYASYNVVVNIRFVLAVWTTLSSMNHMEVSLWSHGMAAGLYFSVCLAFTINLYQIYIHDDFTDIVCDALFQIAAVSSCLLLLRLSWGWYAYVYRSVRASKRMSTQQHLGTVHLTALILLLLSSLAIIAATVEQRSWYDLTSTVMTLQNIKYTLFYVTLIVFENRAVQIDLTMTKVCTLAWHALYVCRCATCARMS